MKKANTHTTRRIGATTISTVLFIAFGSASSVALAAPVGWVSYPENLAANAISIMRNGQRGDYRDGEGFLACDRVELRDSNAEVTVTLATSARILLSKNHKSIDLPCDKPGIGDTLAAYIRTITKKADTRHQGAYSNLVGAVSATSRGSVSAKSRGAISRSNNNAILVTRGTELSIPALVAQTAVISAGERSLHLRWLGGKPPYSVVLAPYPEGRPLISKSDIAEPQVTVPVSGINPGRYVLTVKGIDGKGIEENDMHVMPAGSVPAMPSELASAALSKTAKTLFYADYLVGFEDGRWTMEALQQAASVAAGSPEAEEWLQRWGGTASKP